MRWFLTRVFVASPVLLFRFIWIYRVVVSPVGRGLDNLTAEVASELNRPNIDENRGSQIKAEPTTKAVPSDGAHDLAGCSCGMM